MDTVVIGLIVAAIVIIVVGGLLVWRARRNGLGPKARARTAAHARREAEENARAADRTSAQANDLEARARSEHRAADDKEAESARLRDEAEQVRLEAEREQRRADELDPDSPRTSGQVAGSPDDDLTAGDDHRGRHRP